MRSQQDKITPVKERSIEEEDSAKYKREISVL
jgi:hypothetical protein